MYYLGIDLGTSAVKVLVTNKENSIVCESSRSYDVDFPKDKWAEQNPEDWWEMTVEAIKEVIEKGSIKPDEVSGIGFSGQMHGLVALDKNNEILFPCILWCDNRTEDECEEITEYFTPDGLREATANKALTGFTAPKVKWVEKNRPELFNEIAHILLPKDYLRFRLTGDYVMDVSDAAGSLMLDVKNRVWSKKMLEYLNVDEDVMPSLCESYQVTGKVSGDVLDLLGLTGDVKVVGGASDNAAGAVGAGVVKEGLVLVTLGTSGVVFAPSNNFAVDDECKLNVFCDATGKYHSMGVILSAANSLKWWSETNGIDVQLLIEEAESEKDKINKVIFLPHLMGERFDANTKGCFLGMDMTTTRGMLTRAVLEGVAYFLNDSLEVLRELGLAVDTIRVIGGGSQSVYWKQILSDVMNVNIEEINTSQGGALGASILAMVGDGHFKNVEEACDKLIKVSSTMYPIEANVEMYSKTYELYKKSYPALKEWFDYSNKI